jgi:hypothetical protein
MRTDEMIRELTDAELDEAAGAEANLYPYVYCWIPQPGLYLGPSCPETGILGPRLHK